MREVLDQNFPTQLKLHRDCGRNALERSFGEKVSNQRVDHKYHFIHDRLYVSGIAAERSTSAVII